MDNPRPLYRFLVFFKQTFLQQTDVKNVHPVNTAGIWTHDLQNITTKPGLPSKKVIGIPDENIFVLLYNYHLDF